ncbi:hypothetical protein CFP65_6517 [Kitasatospora sp. MMS16-BH015]|uniref:nuclear transport factor 2 family protein n=1 Tax=Kitasatospora sp. MMS16-BH015 TaxID=2018025 RepID=UPI000CA304E5|nr:nuclear transport factor 2 family protein [Kitasatospora sp. MMS16-BH015]AUG81170.1 hypothetical protein CFP65_6517 [Kitasatospora sp. MMS16-BH015]
MSTTTTRHLINRRRRLAARPTSPDVIRPEPPEPQDQATPEEAPAAGRPGRLTHRALLPLLAALTVLLGGFSAWAATHAAELRTGGGSHNAALADPARTSEVKGAVTAAVNALFSYNYADTARTDNAAKSLLTGGAVQQYAGMLAQVRQQAPQQKLVLTTTVTDSGVVQLDGDRARLLVFADQRNTSTAAGSGQSSYAAAMFAVDVIRQGGSWRISNLDTFNS